MVVTMVNEEMIAMKRAQRLNKIEEIAKARNISSVEAAMFVDLNGSNTTNLKMLNEVGYDITVVTEDNYVDVIQALAKIGVFVINVPTLNTAKTVKLLNNVINEEITECWGGPDMQEFVDLYGDQIP
jgi:5'-3' exonuclease